MIPLTGIHLNDILTQVPKDIWFYVNSSKFHQVLTIYYTLKLFLGHNSLNPQKNLMKLLLNPHFTQGNWSIQRLNNLTKHVRAGLPSRCSGVIRICLPLQATRVQSLVWEESTLRWATKPMRHNLWAHTLQLLKSIRLESLLYQRSHVNEKPTHCNEQ